MAIVLQLVAWTAIVAGNAGWIWLLAGRPRLARNFTWAWCGVAGYATHVLLLQQLVAWDVPVRKTAPWFALFSVVGGAIAAAQLARSRRRWSSRRCRQVALVVLGAVLAAVLQARSIVGQGSDRFIARSTLDQVNYVLTAQFVADVPFSTDVAHIGLRPWLYKPIVSKNERLTQSVGLADLAVVSRTDCLRVWGASCLGAIILLGVSSAGMAAVLGRLPATWCAVAGFGAVALPATATVLLDSFFSQLWTLWTFPALLAICRRGTLPHRAQIIFAGCTLGFLFGAYTEFFPLGLGMAVMLLWFSRDSFRDRVFACGAVVAIALLLTSGYLNDGVEYFGRQAGHAANPDYLAGWSQQARTSVGLFANFFSAGPLVSRVGSAILCAAVLAAGVLLPARRYLWLGLAAPLALVAWMLLQPRVPAYALYKMLLGFAPIVVVLALAGSRAIMVRRAPIIRFVTGLISLGAMGASAATSFALHLDAIKSDPLHAAAFEAMWAARDRAERAVGVPFLIEPRGNVYIGAWLAYFARGADAYYDDRVISDRRIPTSRATFRRLARRPDCVWLALDREGPVGDIEPTPELRLRDAHGPLPEADATPVESETMVRLVRASGYGPVERPLTLEFALVPLPSAAPCRIALEGSTTPAIEAASPVLARFNIQCRPGGNDFRLQITPTGRAADHSGPLAVVRDVSIEPPVAEASAAQ